jgi:hypothetical protein
MYRLMSLRHRESDISQPGKDHEHARDIQTEYLRALAGFSWLKISTIGGLL